MNRLTTLLLLTAMIWLSSCAQEDEMPMPEPESHSCLLKRETIEYDLGSIIKEYHYERDTQLVLVTEFYDDDPQQVDTINKVEWENGLVKYFYEGGIEVHFEWNGTLLSKAKVRNGREFSYFFSPNGQLSQINVQYPPNWSLPRPATFQLLWESGNIVEMEARDENDALMYVDRMTYDDKNNPFSVYSYMKFGLDPTDAAYTLSKNSMQTITRSTYENGEIQGQEVKYSVNFRYNEFDYPEAIVFQYGEIVLSYTDCR